MKNYIQKIIVILPKSWAKSTFYIVFLTLLNATFELFGIGLVIPFLSIFLDKADFIYKYFPFFENLKKESLIIIFVFLFLIIFILKNLFLLFYQKIKINFSYDLAKEISVKLYLQYLSNDWFNI